MTFLSFFIQSRQPSLQQRPRLQLLQAQDEPLLAHLPPRLPPPVQQVPQFRQPQLAQRLLQPQALVAAAPGTLSATPFGPGGALFVNLLPLCLMPETFHRFW